MAMKKSQSVPGLMALGMNPVRTQSNAKKGTLTYTMGGAVDLSTSAVSQADKFTELAMHLKKPSWRIDPAVREERAVTPEDPVPKNMKWPRLAPAWLKHDKQVLRFYAYWQESVVERWDENCRYRQVIIMYSMEDGCIQMSEPKVENSGIPQGKFLKRHQVPREDGSGFIGPSDFRVGEDIFMYGRRFHLTGCDRYTRWFFEENGLELQEDEPLIKDSWQKSYTFQKIAEKGGLPLSRCSMECKHLTMFQLGQPPANRKLVQFLLNDRKVLRFKAFWDDPTLYGNRMYFTIHFFLADNTMEINEAHSRNSGRDNYPVFYKRQPLLKVTRLNAYPGMLEPDKEPYEPKDLAVGDCVNVWGRQLYFYDCDDFTQEFYMEYLGHDQKAGCIDVSEQPKRHVALEPPPHMPPGLPEDSIQNVLMIQPKPPQQDLVRLMTLSGELLRFEAVLVNGEPEDENRKFIVGYYPDCHHMACWELQTRNSGHMGGKFAEKKRMTNPDTKEYFTLNELAVGRVVVINKHPLLTTRSDEHTLRYLERFPQEFPFADPTACAMRLAPVANQLHGPIDPDSLKAMASDAGIHLVDHEVITLLRHFCAEQQEGAPPMLDGGMIAQAVGGGGGRY